MAQPAVKFENRDDEKDNLGTGVAEVQGALKAGQMLCLFCEKPCKKTKQRWGTCCRKDVEACEADAAEKAKNGDPSMGEALAKAKSDSDESFKAFISEYQKQCPSGGRGKPRPKFDWVQAQKVVSNRLTTGTGYEGEMMDFEEFAQYRKSRRGEERSAAAAIWKQMELNPKLKRDNLGEMGALRLPVVTKRDKFFGETADIVDNQQVFGGKRVSKKTGVDVERGQMVSTKDAEMLGACFEEFGASSSALSLEKSLKDEDDEGVDPLGDCGGTPSKRNKGKAGIAADPPTSAKKPKVFDVHSVGATARTDAKSTFDMFSGKWTKARSELKEALKSYNESAAGGTWTSSLSEHHDIVVSRNKLDDILFDGKVEEQMSPPAQTHSSQVAFTCEGALLCVCVRSAAMQCPDALLCVCVRSAAMQCSDAVP
jgi:hypothetical protein